MRRNWIYKAQVIVEGNTRNPFKFELYVRANNKRDAIQKGRRKARRMVLGKYTVKSESAILAPTPKRPK